jgi:hypothetical protein
MSDVTELGSAVLEFLHMDRYEYLHTLLANWLRMGFVWVPYWILYTADRSNK